MNDKKKTYQRDFGGVYDHVALWKPLLAHRTVTPLPFPLILTSMSPGISEKAYRIGCSVNQILVPLYSCTVTENKACLKRVQQSKTMNWSVLRQADTTPPPLYQWTLNWYDVNKLCLSLSAQLALAIDELKKTLASQVTRHNVTSSWILPTKSN